MKKLLITILVFASCGIAFGADSGVGIDFHNKAGFTAVICEVNASDSTSACISGKSHIPQYGSHTYYKSVISGKGGATYLIHKLSKSSDEDWLCTLSFPSTKNTDLKISGATIWNKMNIVIEDGGLNGDTCVPVSTGSDTN